MSATGLEVVTFEYPRNVYQAQDFQRVPGNLSFYYQQSQNVRTLSSNLASQGSDLTGFLYVPTLASGDSCSNASASYVPSNVTRQNDLSSRNGLVAIAPWLSPECTLDYLGAAPSNLTNAFVFFLPDQGNETPPSADDAVWNLGDDGQWKSSTNFPVYVVSTQVGQMLLNEMSHYSSNISSVPNGEQLINNYDYPDDAYVRLYIDIGTGSGSGLPSIWVFLLIILAVLLILIGLLSLAMHLIQRKRRNALRMRIATGDIDVESLGMGKLTVPQDMIAKLPLYTYKPAPATTFEKGIPQTSASSVPSPLHQPTCAICLDDFIPSNSRVRELPCRHIFHPECIDLFLHDNSSLCPLCKGSVLPHGYCPTRITNAMVRRERYITRIRQRASNRPVGHQDASARVNRFALFGRHPRPSFETITSTPAPVEMTSVDSAGVPSTSPNAPSHRDREWARRRALAMLGPRPSHDADQGQATSRPRKLFRTIFPGI